MMGKSGCLRGRKPWSSSSVAEASSGKVEELPPDYQGLEHLKFRNEAGYRTAIPLSSEKSLACKARGESI